MSGTYFIDGYNLIHGMGLLTGRTGPGGLAKARLGLLGLLKGSFGDDARSVTVVFDASRAPPGVPAEQDFHGVHVLYALGKREADDLIEDLLHHASVPRAVTVVSDDHRLQQAAKHRHARAMSCGDFLDFLEKVRRRRPPAPPTPEKQEHVSASETERWLEEFGTLENDPEFKDFFERFGM